MPSSTRASDTPEAERARRRRIRRLRLLTPAAVVGVVAALAVLAPALTAYGPEAIDPRLRMALPSLTHPLGTDEFGRDILSRLAFGARITLVVSVASIAGAAGIGTLLGSAAAYLGGIGDLVVMRIADGLLSFPPILLAILVITFLGPSVVNVILVIGLLYVPRFARVAHAATLSVRETEYVAAAKAQGAPTARILRRDILPNIAAPLFVQASLALGHAILLESGLSFLGLGPPPPAPSWGRMIEQSSRFMSLSVWPVVWPAAVVSGTVLAFNLLGDALRDLLDPRLRGSV
ncbi:MAG TPA: ABC transporter permease [bacterium]|nr:ABC transporter permease [bacterium]